MPLPMPKDVPAHRVSEFTARKSRYLILIPVLNEGDRIRNQLIEMIRQDLNGMDVAIADGGSTDSALDESFLKSCNVRALLTKLGPGKQGAQLRMGLSWALDQGYDGIITIDGNGKDGLDSFNLFATALDHGYDFVQGSRYVPGGKAVNTPIDRHLAVKLIHAPLISLAAGFHYTDTTNGFRAFSRRLLEDPRVSPFRSVFTRYELHYYISIRAGRLGLSIVEVPVTRSYPAGQKTPTKIDGIRGRFDVITQLFDACLNRFDPRAWQ